MKRRYYCEHESLMYRSIFNDKQNGKILPIGDIRIGKDLAVSLKTNLIYKITNK